MSELAALILTSNMIYEMDFNDFDDFLRVVNYFEALKMYAFVKIHAKHGFENLNERSRSESIITRYPCCFSGGKGIVIMVIINFKSEMFINILDNGRLLLF